MHRRTRSEIRRCMIEFGFPVLRRLYLDVLCFQCTCIQNLNDHDDDVDDYSLSGWTTNVPIVSNDYSV